VVFVLEEKIKQVIKEYLERMIKSHRTRQGVTTDRHIDCPKCKTYRSIFWSGGRRGYWGKCCSCGFEFPKELSPPGPEEIEEFLERKDEEERMNEIAEMIKALGIKI
jgi:hypothetical protein